MNQRRFFISLLTAVLICLGATLVVSAQEPPPQQQAQPTPVSNAAVSDNQVNRVAKQLYCPVCENISLDVCPTQACADWRELIRQKLALGWTDQQIKDYFALQYGDRVLAEPPTRGLNLVVYILPPLAFLGGALILYGVLRGMRKPVGNSAGIENSTASVDDPYLQRVEEELKAPREGMMDMDEETIDTPVTRPRRLPIWVIVTAFVLLVGFLGLIAWGLNRSMSGPIQIGDKVPDIQMTTFDGKTVHSTDLAGKIIVLNFWASWCKPCEQEAKDLQSAYQHYNPSGDVVFLGLAYVDTEPNSLAYLKTFGVTYPNGPDLRTTVSQMFRIRGVPETYVIGRDGRLRYVKIGPFDSLDEITSAVDPLLTSQ